MFFFFCSIVKKTFSDYSQDIFLTILKCTFDEIFVKTKFKGKKKD